MRNGCSGIKTNRIVPGLGSSHTAWLALWSLEDGRTLGHMSRDPRSGVAGVCGTLCACHGLLHLLFSRKQTGFSFPLLCLFFIFSPCFTQSFYSFPVLSEDDCQCIIPPCSALSASFPALSLKVLHAFQFRF